MAVGVHVPALMALLAASTASVDLAAVVPAGRAGASPSRLRAVQQPDAAEPPIQHPTRQAERRAAREQEKTDRRREKQLAARARLGRLVPPHALGGGRLVDG